MHVSRSRDKKKNERSPFFNESPIIWIHALFRETARVIIFRECNIFVGGWCFFFFFFTYNTWAQSSRESAKIIYGREGFYFFYFILFRRVPPLPIQPINPFSRHIREYFCRTIRWRKWSNVNPLIVDCSSSNNAKPVRCWRRWEKNLPDEIFTWKILIFCC